MDIIWLVLLMILGFGLWILWRAKTKQVVLDAKVLSQTLRSIVATNQLDPEHAVLMAHKHFIAALQSMVSDKQKAAELVTKFADRFPNTKAVWRAHNLRNRVAHETKVKVSPAQAEAVRKALIRALKALR